jgi:hypothetical protein
MVEKETLPQKSAIQLAQGVENLASRPALRVELFSAGENNE